jgi:glucose-1-phosphate cytidylyltransferase
MPELVEKHKQVGAAASFLCIKPYHSFHVVQTADDGMVDRIEDTMGADFWVNGGYFVMNREIFDLIEEGDELVEGPLQRLVAQSKLYAHKYTGFWGCMDTFKEKQMLDDLYHSGDAPWVMDSE